MNDTSIARDHAGNANLFAGIQTTCRDLVRLGELMLSHGTVGDREVVSADYIRSATGAPSSELNAAYGLLWWLNHPGPAMAPEAATAGEFVPAEGPLVPAAPADTYWALGFNDQVLAVLPSQNAIAVRLGPKPPDSSDFGVRTFTTHVLALVS